MKSAFELAMERLGGTAKSYSTAQRQQLTDIDQQFEAKMAQAKFDAKNRLQTAEKDLEKIKQIQNDLLVELRSLEEKREQQKNHIRQQNN